MRELKFRVYDKKQKRMFWPDGGIIPSNPDDYNYPTLDQVFDTSFAPDRGTFASFPYEYYFSDDCVIQQFTGLKDSEGKDVYEGDILEETVDWTQFKDGSIFQRYYQISWSDGETYSFYGHEYAQVITGFIATLVKSTREGETVGDVTGIGNTFKFENCGQDGLVVSELKVAGNIMENKDLLK